MASKMISRPCVLYVVFVALLALHLFATLSAARPLHDEKSTVDDEETMTSAEMQKKYVRPEGAVEASSEGDCSGDCNSDDGSLRGESGLGWDRGLWSEGGGWDEGGNWDKGGGWTNRPPWANPSGGRVQ